MRAKRAGGACYIQACWAGGSALGRFHPQSSQRPLPKDLCQDPAPPPANGRPGSAKAAPSANRRRACWGAASGGAGFGPCQVLLRGSPGAPEGSRWTASRGARSYLVFGSPPCVAGSCRASSQKTHSSRLCERGRQNKQVEGDGSKEGNTQTQKTETREGKGDPNPKPSSTGPEIDWRPNFPHREP